MKLIDIINASNEITQISSIRGDGSNQLESIRWYRCTVHASCFSRRNINCYRYNFRSYKAIAI